MKLATLRNGTRDGDLVLVSRDLAKAVRAAETIAGLATLQQLLDDWDTYALAAERVSAELNEAASGKGSARLPAFDFDPATAMAPLPRAYQWADGSAYVNHVELARKARGAELPASARTPAPAADAKVALEITHLGLGALEDVTLSVRSGEIVGVAGVDGNGQRELASLIAGLARGQGRVRIGERDVTGRAPAERLAAGLAHIPEDRQHGGLVLGESVAANLSLGRRDITGRWRIDRARVLAHARAQIAELDIRPPDPDAIVRSMSGGNQQKVVVGRELSRPSLVAVVAAQPTRGVDLGAVAKIHERLRLAATAGAGVLVISADLDELLALCHRIVVLLRGRLVGEVTGDALANARSTLGLMMTGAARAEAAS